MTHDERLNTILQAERHLQAARNLLREANAPRMLARVRGAIKSVGGAYRHASLAPFREDRQS